MPNNQQEGLIKMTAKEKVENIINTLVKLDHYLTTAKQSLNSDFCHAYDACDKALTDYCDNALELIEEGRAFVAYFIDGLKEGHSNED